MAMKGMPGKKAYQYFEGGVVKAVGISFINLQVTPIFL